MKRLIVNADDFGLAPGVNLAIVELNRAGVLSSSTLMARAAHFAEAVHLAFVQTTLAIGCHIVLVDGTPVLPAREVPSLIDPDGDPGRTASTEFRVSMARFLTDLLRGRIREDEIEAEAIAQIRLVQSSGLSVTHVDTHKHTHVFPRVLAPLLRAAWHCGVPAVRNPFEPAWSMRATTHSTMLRYAGVQALRTQRRAFAKLIRQNGVATTDGTIGILGGSFNPAGLRALLAAMPEGVWELVCHPGYCDSVLKQARTRLLAERETEREALLEVIPQRLKEDPALELIDFRQVYDLRVPPGA